MRQDVKDSAADERVASTAARRYRSISATRAYPTCAPRSNFSLRCAHNRYNRSSVTNLDDPIGLVRAALPMHTGDYSLLVVDDNPVNLEILVEQLTDEGFRVLTAASGRDAIAVIARDKVDLVLLDVMMPGMSGLEVVRILRDDPTTSTLPVVMVTAKADSKDVVEALEMGANDHVTKPVDFPVALARIRALLRSSAQTRRRESPAATEELASGVVLAGRYRIESRIGAGSFGVVFRATHLELDSPVAVKVLRTSFPDDSAAARFRREGVAACRVRHPNAVATMDFGTTESGLAFLVMELLEGRSLHDEMAGRRVFTPERCGQVMVPVCQALAAAHEANIVHRDIKPANIFLHQSPQGEIPKVLDFGIAKILGKAALEHQLTAADAIIGTPAFMAPERFDGRPCDGKCDVYSVGVVLYRMLSGQTPFGNGDDVVTMATAHLTASPAPLSSHCDGLAPELEAAVMSALSKQPDARPSAAVLARQLAAAVGYADTTNTARAGVAQDGEVGQSAVEQAEVDAADIATLPIRLVRGPNRDKD